MLKTALFCAALVLAAPSTFAQPGAFDPVPIEHATGIKPTFNAKENVYKVSKPRKDMASVGGWKLPPFLGTSSYAAFAPTGKPGEVMVMGDNVLYEDEVGPAMDAALQNGLAVTALHNHFFFEEPRLYFMHVDGMGETSAMAAAIRKVLDAPQRVRSAHATSATAYALPRVPADSQISAGPLDAIFDKKGETTNGMYKASFGRPVKMHGMTAGEAMGVNTWRDLPGTTSRPWWMAISPCSRPNCSRC